MPFTFTIWLHSLVIVVASYLLGSIPTGYLLVRFFRKQDIRSVGSGNIGATNVIRSGAVGLGAATFLLDFLKGALAVFLGAWISRLGFPPIPVHNAEGLAALCAVLGHMFPIWLSLRGGKGVATALGVFAVMVPWAALGSLVIFIVVLALSRIVSLASILGAAAFPVLAWFTAPWSHNYLPMAVIVIIVSLILIKHAQNIQRLLTGKEYRFGSGKPSPAANGADGPA